MEVEAGTVNLVSLFPLVGLKHEEMRHWRGERRRRQLQRSIMSTVEEFSRIGTPRDRPEHALFARLPPSGMGMCP
jgi:hypothetical protein